MSAPMTVKRCLWSLRPVGSMAVITKRWKAVCEKPVPTRVQVATNKGRVAFITGSTSGIGLGIAHRLANSGCDVIITGIAGQKVIDDILVEFSKKYSGKCSYFGADFSKENEIAQMSKNILTAYPKGIDILVNNAGFQHVAFIDEFPIETWHKMIAVHLTSSFLLIRSFLPYMKKKGWGRIVNNSSQNGLISQAGKAPYSAAKAGLIGLTKAVALETAEFGITCNAICPGYVETELVKIQIRDLAKQQSKTYEQMREEFFTERHPTKKPILLDEVTSFVAYLCSEDAASITGAALSIDAGFTAR